MYKRQEASSPIENQGLTEGVDPTVFTAEGPGAGDIVFGIASPTGSAIQFPPTSTAFFSNDGFLGDFALSNGLGTVVALVRSSNTSRTQWVFEQAAGMDDDSTGRMSVNADGTVRVGVRRDLGNQQFYCLLYTSPSPRD